MQNFGNRKIENYYYFKNAGVGEDALYCVWVITKQGDTGMDPGWKGRCGKSNKGQKLR